METFSALLAICAENSPVPGEFSTQRPVTRSFDVYFDLRPNKGLSKQLWGWWFETQACPLWRHRNAYFLQGCLTGTESIPILPPIHEHSAARTVRDIFTIVDPFYQLGQTLIQTWISNQTHSKMWNEITYQFTNFSDYTVEVGGWINNFIPHFIIDILLIHAGISS